jgi:hypothetical protein
MSTRVPTAELQEVFDKFENANGVEKSFYLGQITGVASRLAKEGILTEEESKQVTAQSFHIFNEMHKNNDKVYKYKLSRCPFLRNDERGYFCGKSHQGGAVEDHRRMVCDLASLDLWCKAEEHYNCIIFKEEMKP